MIVISGGIKTQKTFELVRKFFGDWQNVTDVVKPVEYEVKKPKKTVRQHIPIPGKSQSSLLIGTLGPVRKSEEYFAASLGNSILGQFGMMGRIGEAVREKEGLAYYAASSLNSWPLSGSWEVEAGCKSEKSGQSKGYNS